MRQDQVEALVEDIFSRLDTNQDGVVTIDEFIEACQRVMKSLLLSSNMFAGSKPPKYLVITKYLFNQILFTFSFN